MPADHREVFQHRDKLDDADQPRDKAVRGKPLYLQHLFGPKGQQDGGDVTENLQYAFTQATRRARDAPVPGGNQTRYQIDSHEADH